MPNDSSSFLPIQYRGHNAQQLDSDLSSFGTIDADERLLHQQIECQFAATHAGQRGRGRQMMTLRQYALWRALQNLPDFVIEVLGDTAQTTLQLTTLQCC